MIANPAIGLDAEEACALAASERIFAALRVFDAEMADADPSEPEHEVRAFDAMKAAIATADALRPRDVEPAAPGSIIRVGPDKGVVWRFFDRFVSWRTVFRAGVWEYQEHRRTGQRRAVRVDRGGHQPQDAAWLLQRAPTPPASPGPDA